MCGQSQLSISAIGFAHEHQYHCVIGCFAVEVLHILSTSSWDYAMACRLRNHSAAIVAFMLCSNVKKNLRVLEFEAIEVNLTGD